jgi:hypothetical protein
MPTYRQAGGPGRTGYHLTWEGARFTKMVDDSVVDALEELGADILDDLHATLHVWTGEMRDKAFAEVELRGVGQRRTLVFGSDAPHTIYHELGWHRANGASFEGHPQIREIADRWVPKFTPMLRDAVKKQGLV